MRGIDYNPTGDQPRPIVGRELEPVSARRHTPRLHVDRPCYVGRGTSGTWTWQCSLCPLPLGLVTNTADDWHAAIDEATRHLGTAHAGPATAPTERGRPLAA